MCSQQRCDQVGGVTRLKSIDEQVLDQLHFLMLDTRSSSIGIPHDTS
jgi:hypothetical protein